MQVINLWLQGRDSVIKQLLAYSIISFEDTKLKLAIDINREQGFRIMGINVLACIMSMSSEATFVCNLVDSPSSSKNHGHTLTFVIPTDLHNPYIMECL